MSDLVEKVARALDPDAWGESAERALDDAAMVHGVTFDAMPWAVRRKKARDKAAEINAVFFDAIAEPSEAQMAAGRKIADWDDVMPRGVYRAMIAALRKETAL